MPRPAASCPRLGGDSPVRDLTRSACQSVPAYCWGLPAVWLRPGREQCQRAGRHWLAASLVTSTSTTNSGSTSATVPLLSAVPEGERPPGPRMHAARRREGPAVCGFPQLCEGLVMRPDVLKKPLLVVPAEWRCAGR